MVWWGGGGGGGCSETKCEGKQSVYVSKKHKMHTDLRKKKNRAPITYISKTMYNSLKCKYPQGINHRSIIYPCNNGSDFIVDKRKSLPSE